MQQTAEDLVRRHSYTVADFERMGEAGIFAPEDRVELVGGEVVDMAPIGSRHAAIVSLVAERLAEAVGRSAIVRVQSPLIVDDETYVEPDLVVLVRREDYYRADHPRPADVLLIVEVAETSLAYDRDVKLPLYARAGIPQVWLVDVTGTVLTVFGEPAGDRYQAVAATGAPAAMSLAALPGTTVDLTGLFA
jgi:Uma2 family endonuclease